MSCQLDIEEETATLGVYPPDDADASLFVDAEAFPASAPDTLSLECRPAPACVPTTRDP